MRFAGLVCLLVGCSFDHGQFNGPRIDGDVTMVDSPLIDGPPGCKTFSTHLDTCTQLLPGEPLSLTGMNTYDTDTLTLSTENLDIVLPASTIVTPAGSYVVVFVTSFTLGAGATLRVVGNSNDRPLGIVATEAVSIAGAIDLTSNGAGARDDANCGTQVGMPGQNDGGGGGGGGGGAFAAAGGKGGNGDTDTGASMGGDEGVAIAMRPTQVTGGCDGGAGGDGQTDTKGGAGDGGGAIFIASAVSITIPGSINASGGGGTGGKGNGGGGGGGGSGGMIVLESKSVSIAGKLAANGGGGGEGADGADGDIGTTGALSAMRAAGGSGDAPEGADGGGGGAGANTAGLAPSQLKKGGGGGGGGGVGFIAIGPSAPLTTGGAVISPAYQAWP